jgi:hypothetical protein
MIALIVWTLCSTLQFITFEYIPNLVNSVDILAVRHVKRRIEAERFRVDQLWVLFKHITPTLIHENYKSAVSGTLARLVQLYLCQEH